MIVCFSLHVCKHEQCVFVFALMFSVSTLYFTEFMAFFLTLCVWIVIAFVFHRSEAWPTWKESSYHRRVPPSPPPQYQVMRKLVSLHRCEAWYTRTKSHRPQHTPLIHLLRSPVLSCLWSSPNCLTCLRLTSVTVYQSTITEPHLSCPGENR